MTSQIRVSANIATATNDFTGVVMLTVTTVMWIDGEEVDPRYGFLLPDTPTGRRNARRLVAAFESGRAYTDAGRATDVNGVEFGQFTKLVHGRTLNADLKRLGF